MTVRPRTERWRRLPRIMLGTAVATLLVLSPSVPADAHATAVSCWPAVNELVTEMPDRVTVEYDAELLPDVVVEVVGPDGTSLADGDPVVQGRFVTQAMVDAETAGVYTAFFHVFADDLHPVEARVDFVVDPDGTATGNPAGDPPDLRLDDEVVTSEATTHTVGQSGLLPLLVGFGAVVVLIVAIRVAARRKLA